MTHHKLSCINRMCFCKKCISFENFRSIFHNQNGNLCINYQHYLDIYQYQGIQYHKYLKISTFLNCNLNNYHSNLSILCIKNYKYYIILSLNNTLKGTLKYKRSCTNSSLNCITSKRFQLYIGNILLDIIDIFLYLHRNIFLLDRIYYMRSLFHLRNNQLCTFFFF